MSCDSPATSTTTPPTRPDGCVTSAVTSTPSRITTPGNDATWSRTACSRNGRVTPTHPASRWERANRFPPTVHEQSAPRSPPGTPPAASRSPSPGSRFSSARSPPGCRPWAWWLCGTARRCSGTSAAGRGRGSLTRRYVAESAAAAARPPMLAPITTACSRALGGAVVGVEVLLMVGGSVSDVTTCRRVMRAVRVLIRPGSPVSWTVRAFRSSRNDPGGPIRRIRVVGLTLRCVPRTVRPRVGGRRRTTSTARPDPVRAMTARSKPSTTSTPISCSASRDGSRVTTSWRETSPRTSSSTLWQRPERIDLDAGLVARFPGHARAPPCGRRGAP